MDTTFILFTGGDEISGIFGLDDDGELWRNIWEGVSHADFNDFVDCGFFTEDGRDRYLLKKGKIINAVESDFQPVQQQNNRLVINAGDNATFVFSRDIVQKIDAPEASDRLIEALEGIAETNQQLREAIEAFRESTEENRVSTLGGIIEQLGRSLIHGANTAVIMQTLLIIIQMAQK